MQYSAAGGSRRPPLPTVLFHVILTRAFRWVHKVGQLVAPGCVAAPVWALNATRLEAAGSILAAELRVEGLGDPDLDATVQAAAHLALRRCAIGGSPTLLPDEIDESSLRIHYGAVTGGATPLLRRLCSTSHFCVSRSYEDVLWREVANLLDDQGVRKFNEAALQVTKPLAR